MNQASDVVARRTGSVAAIAGPHSDEVPNTESLQRRVRYLMLFRLVLISLVMGATILTSVFSRIKIAGPHSIVLFSIIGGTYLLTLFYAFAIKHKADPVKLASAQVIGDLITSTLLVHITGGAQSGYTFLYPLTIIGAATLQFRSGAVLTAISSAILFTMISLLGWYEILPIASDQPVSPSEPGPVELTRLFALNLAAFAGVAVLAYNLGGQIQKTTANLAVEREYAADLVALHEDIVRCLSSGLITIDTQYSVLTINDAACDILRTKSHHATGKHIDALLPGFLEKIRDLPDRTTLRRANLEMTTEDGMSLALGLSSTPLRNNEDDVIGRIVNFQDLTELRKMERQVKQAERLAAIGTLAAGVAHEIRNPLASISGSVELLRTSDTRGDEEDRLMDIVTREIDRLNIMITDLLDYTNPSPRRAVQFDLRELVNETLFVFRQAPEFNDVTFETEPTQPEGQQAPVVVDADPGRIRQVIWNILRNGAEAATDGGGTVRVAVEKRQDVAVVEIEDNGPGLSPDSLERVFDPFFTTKQKGSGLGLAICHSIIRDHHGSLIASGALGTGCLFRIELPVAA